MIAPVNVLLPPSCNIPVPVLPECRGQIAQAAHFDDRARGIKRIGASKLFDRGVAHQKYGGG